jgi:hypothetical protein
MEEQVFLDLILLLAVAVVVCLNLEYRQMSEVTTVVQAVVLEQQIVPMETLVVLVFQD